MNPTEEIALAKQLFNACWDLIEKEDRTVEEDIEMIHLAHTSRWHWGNVGGIKERAIGEWQCARVHALLGHGETAYLHASQSYALSEELPQPNFMTASATEALAFAEYIRGNLERAQELKIKALDQLNGVDEQDAGHTREQIQALPF